MSPLSTTLTIKLKLKSYDSNLLCPPFNLVGNAYTNYRARQDIKLLKKAFKIRKGPVIIDAVDASNEHIKRLLSCQCITVLKMNKFNETLFNEFHKQQNIKSVHMFFNRNFPFLPVVRNLILDASDVTDFTVNDVKNNISFETTNLSLMLQYDSMSQINLLKLASFLQLNVKSMNVGCFFTKAVDQDNKSLIEETFIKKIKLLLKLIQLPLLTAPSTHRRIVIIFDWKLFKRYMCKQLFFEIFFKNDIPCAIVSEDADYYSYSVLMPAELKCHFEIAFV